MGHVRPYSAEFVGNALTHRRLQKPNEACRSIFGRTAGFHRSYANAIFKSCTAMIVKFINFLVNNLLHFDEK